MLLIFLTLIHSLLTAAESGAHPMCNTVRRRSAGTLRKDIQDASAEKYVRGCYFTNWAQYRPGKGKYNPEHYQANLCEYIFYAFAKLNDDFTVDQFEWNDIDILYPAVMKQKSSQPDLKVLLSLGGWNAGTATFKKMAATSSNRAKFISSLVSFLKQNKFDGFDLDWEYPESSDKENYLLLCQEILAKFEEVAKSSSTSRLLFTAAVSANPEKVDAGYDVPALAKVLDFVNLMSYDFHGAWETKTGINSPLHSRKDDSSEFKLWNVEESSKYWSNKGMPKKQIIIGLPTYGRGWTLSDASKSYVGAPAQGSSTATEYLREAGVISYYEVCQKLSSGAKRVWDEESKTPYVVQGNQWFSYDDVESLTAKINWIKQEKYGGAFVWTLDYDDFLGSFCSQHNGKKYPLISLMQEMLGNGYVSPSTESTTSQVTTTPSTTTTTTSPAGAFQCPSDGLFPDPQSCNNFYQCAGGTAFKMQCPSGLMFNPKTSSCDYSSNVDCQEKNIS
ncbi:Acidic mammalian chitinase [Trichuris trichiura]|uniref:Acidic mammalian chitinase n=1 Tax=Trichuris trichiura TaxID=36087 RepID=A0A077Z8H9_TRITR|nr:Acidic mammalian chitinase [Trichuris trichiura]